MADLDDADGGYTTWSHGYDEGRRHGHKECRDEIARLRAVMASRPASSWPPSKPVPARLLRLAVVGPRAGAGERRDG